MSEWIREARFCLRLLRKSPGFTAVAVLSLALGIGVNTAVLGVARTALFTPLPVDDPGQLHLAHWHRPDPTKGTIQFNSGGATDTRTGKRLDTNYSYPTFTALREATKDHAALVAFTFLRQASASLGQQPVLGGGMIVSGNYFADLRVPIHIGRGISERDDRPDAEPVAVIGYRLWQRAFGGDPAVIGKTIHINGSPFTLIGITGRDYFGVSNGGFFPTADVSVPLSAQPLVSPRWTTFLKGQGTLFTSDRTYWLRIMARVRPGVDVRQAEAVLSDTYVRALNASAFPIAPGVEPPAIVLQDGSRGLDSMRPDMERPLMLLGGVAALVFLIACVNIASLVLVRGVARQRELWVRLALGAGRARLVRQTIVESLVLAIAGGLLGILLAIWTAPLIVTTLARTSETALVVQLDLPLIAMASFVALMAAFLFGLLPALRVASTDRADLMRQTGVGIPRLRAGRALVLAQVAIAMPLVLGAALFLRTIHNLSSVDLGFEPRGLVTFRLDPTLNGYDATRTASLYARALERLEMLAGIQGVTLIENPLISGIVSNTRFETDGGSPQGMFMNRVGPGFFETMGLPLTAGRGIGLQDTDTAPDVGVINETGAHAFFGTTAAVGRRLRVSGGTGDIEIVGVARDTKYASLKDDVQPTIYLPYFQSTGLGAMHIVFRARTAGGEMEPLVRQALAEVDPLVPIAQYKTQTRQIDETIGSERALTTMLVFFGGFALLLACIGLHGVTAYAVARRTTEIGIRLALGAQRRSVLWLMLRQVVVLGMGGLLIGIPAAVLGSRALQSQLFGVAPTDAMSLAGGAAVLFAVVVASGFIPARKASRLDPLVALRRE